MREPAEREEIRKEVILRKCFNVLTENGVEGATIRNFSDATGMTASSLYYWFEDKDEIIVDAAEFGLQCIVEKLFRYALDNINDVKNLCNEFYKIADKYKMELRLIFQIANSPKYGEKIRGHSDSLSHIYDEYMDKLADAMNVSSLDIRGSVDLFISAITYYVMWDDRLKVSREMEYVIREIESCKIRKSS